MSNLELIERLADMLTSAVQVIREQAALLTQHGIVTGTGEFERARQKLLDDIDALV